MGYNDHCGSSMSQLTDEHFHLLKCFFPAHGRKPRLSRDVFTITLTNKAERMLFIVINVTVMWQIQ